MPCNVLPCDAAAEGLGAKPSSVSPPVPSTPVLPKATTTSIPDFIAIATPLVSRGFRVTPVHPETKCGVLRNWQNHQATDVTKVSEYAKHYPHHNIGVVGKRGVGRHCFLDIDADGVESRITQDTGKTLPETYTVQSRPQSAPFKKHLYFTQTDYSFKAFGRLANDHTGWESKNLNVKDLTRLERSRKGNLIHPTLYDVKGVGGGSLVVGAGSVRDNGEVYAAVNPDAPVIPIPDWLVDWLVKDFRAYRQAVLTERKKKCAKKAVERDRYTKAQLSRLHERGDAAGFDIFEEDIEWFMHSRAGSFASLGARPDVIEAALVGEVEDYCVNGKAYVANNADKIHEIATSEDLDIKPPSDWYMRQAQKRNVTDLVVEPLPQILTKRQQRDEAMREAIAKFPATVTTYESNSRFEDALADIGVTFAPERTHKHRGWAGATLKAAGYKWDKTRQVWQRARRKR